MTWKWRWIWIVVRSIADLFIYTVKLAAAGGLGIGQTKAIDSLDLSLAPGLATLVVIRTKISIYCAYDMLEILWDTLSPFVFQSSQIRCLLSTFFREANELNFTSTYLGGINQQVISWLLKWLPRPILLQESSFVEMFFFNVICLECQDSISWGKLMTVCLQGIKSLTQTLMPLCPPPISKNPPVAIFNWHITIPISIQCNSMKTMIATLKGRG